MGRKAFYYLSRFMACVLSAAMVFSPAVRAESSGGQTNTPAEVVGSIVHQTGFEDQADNWFARGNDGILQAELVTEVKHSGSRSLKVAGRLGNWNGPAVSMLDFCEVGLAYDVSLWIYQDSGVEKRVIISYEIANGGASSYTNMMSKTIPSGEWAEFKCEFTALRDVSIMPTTLVLYAETLNDGTDGSFATLYVDDVVIAEQVADMTVSIPEEEIPALGDLYADYFSLGVAVNNSYFTSDTRMALVDKHFDTITAENEMKPSALLGSQPDIGSDGFPKLNFETADSFCDYAEEKSIKMRGHTLIWHSQTPDWFFNSNYSTGKDARRADKDEMLARMENYIMQVLRHFSEEYPGLIIAWDVVNEAVADDGGIRTESPWYETIGDEFIERAFEFARKYADDDTLLFYNDYSTIGIAKRKGIVEILTPVAEAGNIDGMGMQGHYGIATSVAAFEEAARIYGSIVEFIHITELDIAIPTRNESNLLAQATRYKELFDACKRLVRGGVKLTNVTFWGLSDALSWKAGEYPLLFDSNLIPKLAFWALVGGEHAVVETKSIRVPRGTVKPGNINEEPLWAAQSGAPIGGLGSFKLAYDYDWFYILVESEPGSKVSYVLGEDGQAVSFVVGADGVAEAAFSRPRGSSFVAAVSGRLAFDIAIDNGSETAAWNNLYYDGEFDSDRQGTLFFGGPVEYATIPKGTPEMSFEDNELWDGAALLNVSKLIEGTIGAPGTAKVLWDEDYLYVLVEVSDDGLYAASENAYEHDSVEIFIDQKNNKSGAYKDGDTQYRINYLGEKTISSGRSAGTDSFDAIAEEVDGGYRVMARLPHTMEEAFQEGQFTGFDVQINNSNGTARASVSIWCDESGASWQDTSGFGVIKLIGRIEDEQ